MSKVQQLRIPFHKSVLLKYTHLEKVTTHSKTPARPGRHCNSGTNCSPCREQVNGKAEAYKTSHRQNSHLIIIPSTYKALRCDISYKTETRLRATSPRKRFWALTKKKSVLQQPDRIWNIFLCSIHVAAIFTGGILVEAWNRILTSHGKQVKNTKKYTSALPYAFIMRCLIKNRERFKSP